MFSTEERIEIMLLFAKLESYTLLRRHLQNQRWENIPSEKTVRSIFQKFKDTGSVHDLPKSGRPSLDLELHENIKSIFQNRPTSSVRAVAMEVECSHMSVYNVIRRQEKLFPYKLQVTQKLYEEDHALRVSMAETLIEKISNEIDFLENIIFSDESTFFVNGVVNRHNCRVWGTEPPDETIEVCHSSPKVNVWMGISATTVYRPFFIEGNVTGENYLDMLEKCFLPQMFRRTAKKLFFSRMELLLTTLSVSENSLTKTLLIVGLDLLGRYKLAPTSPDLTP